MTVFFLATLWSGIESGVVHWYCWLPVVWLDSRFSQSPAVRTNNHRIIKSVTEM